MKFRIAGRNGPVRSFSRTRLCTHSPRGRVRFGGADVPAEQRLADLENTLAQVKLDVAENVPLLAPLLDIPLPADRALRLPPDELRRRQLAAMTNWTMAAARTQAIVMAVEDIHWADPIRSTSCEAWRNAERWRLCSLSSRPALNFGRRGDALTSQHDHTFAA